MGAALFAGGAIGSGPAKGRGLAKGGLFTGVSTTTGVSINGSIVNGLPHLGHLACLPTLVSFVLNLALQFGHCVFIV